MATGFRDKLGLIGLYAAVKIKGLFGGGQTAGPQNARQTSAQEVFDKLPGLLKPEAAVGVDTVYQFSLSGTRGGEWNVSIKDAICAVQQGTHTHPAATLRMPDEDFVALITGGQFMSTAMQAFSSGRLKIEGDKAALQLIPKLFRV